MKIIDDLLFNLHTETEVKDIRQGPFQTAVLTRNCGLASTPHYGGSHHSTAPVAESGLLLEKDASALAWLANSPSLHEAAIGMATINSAIDIDETQCIRLNAGDLIAERGRDKRVAIVGHFPFVARLRGKVKDLWVIEKSPRDGDFSEPDAQNLIPQADVVGITGTAFTNHTIEHLLELCNPEAYVVILGDTSPMTPVLFDYGIDAISGTKVFDSNLALRCVSQGATFRQIMGIELVTMMKKPY
ncbi:Rossmann-like domain-containing protein [Chloroflexota bacterium]